MKLYAIYIYIADSINDSFAKVSRKSVEYSDKYTSIYPRKNTMFIRTMNMVLIINCIKGIPY